MSLKAKSFIFVIPFISGVAYCQAASAPAAGTLGNTAGSIIFGAEVGLSIADFAQAKNDRDRTYAGARVAVAGIATVNPLAGLVAGVVLSGVKAMDDADLADHNRKMFEIHARIAETYRQSALLSAKMYDAEALMYEQYRKRMIEADKKWDASISDIRGRCLDPDKFQEMREIDSCIDTYVGAIDKFKYATYLIQAFFNTNALYVKVDNVLSANHMAPKEEWMQLIDKRNQEAAKMELDLDHFLGEYAKASAKIVMDKVNHNSDQMIAYKFKSMCLIKSQDLSLAASEALLNSLTKKDTSEMDQKFKLGLLRSKMQRFESNKCEIISSGDGKIDKMYQSSRLIFHDLYAQLNIESQ